MNMLSMEKTLRSLDPMIYNDYGELELWARLRDALRWYNLRRRTAHDIGGENKDLVSMKAHSVCLPIYTHR